MTKKRIVIITSILLIIIIGVLSSYFFLKKDNDYKEQNEKKQKDTILLKENLEFEINSELTLLSLVSEDNKVKVLNDDEIDTSSLGKKEITIKYEVEEDEEEKTVTISIIDTQAPTIEFEKELSTIVGTKIDLLKDVKVTDNSKEEIKASVDGDYDFDKEGIYNLRYVAIDSSNNKKEEEFTLKVSKKQTSATNTKPSNNSNKGNSSSQSNTNTNNSTSQSNNEDSSSNTQLNKPWEALGMTENQYYNEPILKNARIDFPVEICGSEKACNTACLESGDKVENGAYNCMPIKTASGRYLGEMLNVKKLQ